MKRIAAYIAILTVLVLGPTDSQAQLGVVAGLNFESISDIETTSGQGTWENASGYHVGLFLDLGAGPVGLRVGAIYRELGEFDVTLDAVTSTVDVSALDFPVDLRFSVIPTPVVKPYLLAGPVFSIPRSDDEDYDASLESVSVAGNVGFGVEINAGGLTLLPEFRYTIGVTPFVKDEFTLAGRDFTVEKNDARSNTAMLRLGIKF